MEFKPFDARHYPTLAVSEGYAEWARTYDAVVQDEMDLRLLARLTAVDWAAAGCVLDLACGTGRIGLWLRAQGVMKLDGLDLTPAMLRRAQARGVYNRLLEGDVRDTGLPAARYDLALMVLADEHLEDLVPMYREVARIAKAGACFVMVGYHPHFMLNGIPTHFNRASGQPVAIETYVHLLSDHFKAARQAGWGLLEMDEGLVDEAWLVKKPKWARYRNHPVSFAMVWRRP
jgi:SAM-dependent methyltransferase